MADDERGRPLLRWFVCLAVIGVLVAATATVWRRNSTAQSQFQKEVGIVGEIVAKADPAVRAKIHELFLREAAPNPTFASFMQDEHGWFSQPDGFVGDGGSGYRVTLGGWLGENSVEWEVILSTPYASYDFTKLPVPSGDTRVSVTVRCVRSAGLVGSLPRIEIIDRGAPQDPLLIDALGTELAQRGLAYTVRKGEPS